MAGCEAENETISVAVVTFNNRHTIADTLASLLLHLPQPAVHIIAIDNGSSDGTQAVVRDYAARHTRIQTVFNTENIGFGRAHNQALNAIESRYHVICNPDIRLHTDVFTPLARFLGAHPEIGICCPKFLNPNGTLQPLNRRLPTVLDLLLRRVLPKALEPVFKLRLESYDMRDVGYEQVCDVPFVSGAFMFCRTQLLKQVGGFDRRFFLYFEDADLTRRVNRHGYRTVFFPNATVTHTWHRLAHRSLRGSWLFAASAYRYFRKWGFKWC
jgi:GT2 family glycosyltransferase